MYKPDMVAKGIERERIRQMIRQQVTLGNLEAANQLADKHDILNTERLDLGIELSSNPKHNKMPRAMGCV